MLGVAFYGWITDHRASGMTRKFVGTLIGYTAATVSEYKQPHRRGSKEVPKDTLDRLEHKLSRKIEDVRDTEPEKAEGYQWALKDLQARRKSNETPIASDLSGLSEEPSALSLADGVGATSYLVEKILRLQQLFTSQHDSVVHKQIESDQEPVRWRFALGLIQEFVGVLDNPRGIDPAPTEEDLKTVTDFINPFWEHVMDLASSAWPTSKTPLDDDSPAVDLRQKTLQFFIDAGRILSERYNIDVSRENSCFVKPTAKHDAG